jgi:hypothetical protein
VSQADAGALEVSSGARSPLQSEPHGATTRAPASHQGSALNLQPLLPGGAAARPGNPLFTERVDVPGIASLIAVPGFSDAPIAIARMADRTMLILDRGEDGATRVAGTFSGPIGALDASGDWATSASADRVSIYRVTRS